MLAGDFLITQNGKQVGLRKKIRRLGNKVAVGWTGNLLSAEVALKHLGERLAQDGGRNEVEVALREFDVAGLPGSVVLVGWVADGEIEGFLWQSTNPEVVTWGAPWYVGSGGQLLEGMAGPRGLRADPDRVGDPRLSGLSITTNLMADEAIDRKHRQLGIGHAYELIWWTGDRFEYVDDVLYMTIRVEFDEAGVVKSVQPLEPWFKYFVRDEFSVVAICTFRDGIELHVNTPVGPVEPGVTDTASAHALVEEMVAGMATGTWSLPLSSYYGAFLDLRAPGYVGPLFSLVLEEGKQPDPPIFEELTPKSISVHLPKDVLTGMYEEIRRDQQEDRS